MEYSNSITSKMNIFLYMLPCVPNFSVFSVEPSLFLTPLAPDAAVKGGGQCHLSGPRDWHSTEALAQLGLGDFRSWAQVVPVEHRQEGAGLWGDVAVGPWGDGGIG